MASSSSWPGRCTPRADHAGLGNSGPLGPLSPAMSPHIWSLLVLYGRGMLPTLPLSGTQAERGPGLDTEHAALRGRLTAQPDSLE